MQALTPDDALLPGLAAVPEVRSLLEAVDLPIDRWDAEGRLTFFNPPYLAWAHRTPQELRGKKSERAVRRRGLGRSATRFRARIRGPAGRLSAAVAPPRSAPLGALRAGHSGLHRGRASGHAPPVLGRSRRRARAPWRFTNACCAVKSTIGWSRRRTSARTGGGSGWSGRCLRCVTVPTHARSSFELLQRADDAMYTAKNEGKNRWAFCNQRLDGGENNRPHL